MISPPTRNTTVRGPGASTASRKLPGPESSRLRTKTTRPPRPPGVAAPKPSAPGEARAVRPRGSERRAGSRRFRRGRGRPVAWRRPASYPSSACGLAALLALSGAAATAQDRRTVVEPRFPPACTVLEARLDAPGGLLSEESERRPDTERLQEAIDRCPAGQAVKLTRAGEKHVFLTGPLRLKPGVTLWVDAHAAALRLAQPAGLRRGARELRILTPTNARGRGCRPLLLAEDAPGSGVMGDGAIDGRGGAVLLGQDLTWWQLAKKAKVLDLPAELPAGPGRAALQRFTLYRITIRSSPSFHVVAEQTDGFTAWGVKIRTPRTARNSDGIDPSSSTNVTIAHCHIDTGDDNVAIKAGGAGPATHMTIAHNHFYSGHGMSIGSNTNGGARAIRVVDLTIDGADNGLRIKSDRSRGGLVEDVSYENVCMRNVANPIVLTTMYTTFPGDRLPVYRDIRLKDVRSVTTGWSTVRVSTPGTPSRSRSTT